MGKEKGKEEFRYPAGHNWEGLTPDEVNVAYAKIPKKKPKTKPKVKKAKESKFTKKIRNNPYIITTFALSLLGIILIVGSVIENKPINKTEDEILCSVIYSTPAWISADGKIVQYGVLIPINQSIDLVNQVFIPDRIKLLYNSGCSACQEQIDYLKGQGTWEDYKNEGLAINCGEI